MRQGSGEVFKAQIPGAPMEAIGWMQSLPGPVRAVYEAGPIGFGLARAARAGLRRGLLATWSLALCSWPVIRRSCRFRRAACVRVPTKARGGDV